MAKPTTIDEYLDALPADRRAVMDAFRATVTAAAPMATEVIAYDMPALRTSDARFLISYASYKNHYSLFPASDEVVRVLGEDVAPFVAGKGTLQFPAKHPLPLQLIERIVKVRVAETTPTAPAAPRGE